MTDLRSSDHREKNGFLNFSLLRKLTGEESQNGFGRYDEAKEGFLFVSFKILYSDSILRHHLLHLVVYIRSISDYTR